MTRPELLMSYCPLVERLGFDENFMDITEMVERRLAQTAEPNNISFEGHVYNNLSKSDSFLWYIHFVLWLMKMGKLVVKRPKKLKAVKYLHQSFIFSTDNMQQLTVFLFLFRCKCSSQGPSAAGFRFTHCSRAERSHLQQTGPD